MHADVLGHVAQDERPHRSRPPFEELPLELEQTFHHLVDGPLPLLDTLDEPFGVALVLAQVAARFRRQPVLLFEQLLVFGRELQLRQPLVIELDDEFAVDLEHVDVRNHVVGLLVAELVARVGGERLDERHRLLHPLQRRARFAGQLGVVARLEQTHVLIDDQGGERVFLVQPVELEEQGLADVAGGDTGRVEALHQAQGALGLLLGAAAVGADVGDVRLEKAVPVEVAEDELGEFDILGGQLQVGELPHQVGFQPRGGGDEIELRRCVRRRGLVGEGKVAVKGVGIVLPVDFGHGGRIVSLHLVGDGGFGLVGILLGGQGVRVGWRLELGLGLLEHGVLLDLRLQGLGQLEAAELQQLDRLPQLRGHHQLLGEFQVLSEFKRHGLHPVPLHAAGRRRHMWKLSPRYILRATTLSMMSAATPLVRIWPLFMM